MHRSLLPPSEILPDIQQTSTAKKLSNIRYQYTKTLRSLIFTRPCVNECRFFSILLVFAIIQRWIWGRRCVGTFIGHYEGEEWPICTVNGRPSSHEEESLINVCLSYNFPERNNGRLKMKTLSQRSQHYRWYRQTTSYFDSACWR